MRADSGQNQKTASRPRQALLHIPKVQKKDPSGDRPHDIFDVVARHSVEKDGLRRSISATIALLKRAQTMIENAEQKITAQNERIRVLEDLSTTDELTGLSNLRGLHVAFTRELARMKRGLAQQGLLVQIEVENLATISETYSPDAAQSCLKFLGRILGNETRSMDIAAHVRDGLFILLFTNSAPDKAVERAQKLALRLNNLSLIRRGREIQISSSMGLKAYSGFDRLEDLLEGDRSSPARQETV